MRNSILNMTKSARTFSYTTYACGVFAFSLFSFAFPSQVAGALEVLQNSVSIITGSNTLIWPNITATSALVYDPISQKILYAKNADEVKSIASLNKLMTAAVADNLLRTSPPLASKTLHITKAEDSNKADQTLKTGTSWGTDDLIKYMLIGSSNKAAETIASGLIPRESFLSLMNFEARRLGLKSTSFTNPSGLNTVSKVKGVIKNTAGGYSTAKEVAYMLWKIIEEHSGLLEITQLKHVTFSNGQNAFAIDNTNKILKDLPIVVGKTGFTEQSGGNLVVVLQTKPTAHAYVIVVLGSTEEARFTDVAALASTTLTYAGGN
jgi:serine-type D-Ala-D-Ala carboxypeptidase (penicillin-binding protein 5/6)